MSTGRRLCRYRGKCCTPLAPRVVLRSQTWQTRETAQKMSARLLCSVLAQGARTDHNDANTARCRHAPLERPPAKHPAAVGGERESVRYSAEPSMRRARPQPALIREE